MGVRPVKDWRDVTQYSYVNMTMKKWGWEFLRRNPQYQEAYDELCKIGPDKWGLKPRDNPDGYMSVYLCDPAAHPNETCAEYVKRKPNNNVKTPLRIFRDSWHIHTPKDPSEDYSSGSAPKFIRSSFRRYSAKSLDTAKAIRGSRLALRPNEVYVKFFLDQDIKMQLKNIAGSLSRLQMEFHKILQEVTVSPHFEAFKNSVSLGKKIKMKNASVELITRSFLRVLDADLMTQMNNQEDIKPAEISKQFTQDVKPGRGEIPADVKARLFTTAKIKAMRKRAHLLSKNYWYVVFSEADPS